MNKGILIIDKIPEYCDEHCKFCDSFFNCLFVGDVEEAWRNKQRDPKCPVRPLPNEKHRKTNDDIARALDYGWNSCLAALEGKDMIDKLMETYDDIMDTAKRYNTCVDEPVI